MQFFKIINRFQCETYWFEMQARVYTPHVFGTKVFLCFSGAGYFYAQLLNLCIIINMNVEFFYILYSQYGQHLFFIGGSLQST